MMKNLGIALICISAFFYGIRYLSAAIYGSSTHTWSNDLFKYMLEYVGPGPLILSWISLISGISLIVFPEIKNRLNREVKQNKEN